MILIIYIKLMNLFVYLFSNNALESIGFFDINDEQVQFVIEITGIVDP